MCEAKQHKTCPEIDVNGCGPALLEGLDYFYREALEPTCNKHDVCYGCAAMYGWKRAECDEAFRVDMSHACRCIDDYVEGCRTTANAFHTAVVALGVHFFSETAAPWCECAESRGDVDAVFAEIKALKK